MKRLLVAAALAAAVPVSAQLLTSDQGSSVASATAAARTLAKRLAPAPVDAKTVAAMAGLLSKDGSQRRLREGAIGNVLTRITPPDALGRFRGLQANLVELPPAPESPDSMVRDLVMRREFSRLEATSDYWTVDPQTGVGQVDEWRYTVSLDGKLLAVVHAIVPVEPDADDGAAPNESEGRSYQMSPSDSAVQKRWKKFSRELLTLGKTVDA